MFFTDMKLIMTSWPSDDRASIRCVFADSNRATNELNQQDIDLSVGVICSYFHEMYVLSGMTGCEQVDSFK